MHSNTSNTRKIDFQALTAALRSHGFQSPDTPLIDGRAQPLQPGGWIRRDGQLITYGDRDRTYTTGGQAER